MKRWSGLVPVVYIIFLMLPIYWLLAPVFRRSRVLTTADFFQRRFGALKVSVRVRNAPCAVPQMSAIQG